MEEEVIKESKKENNFFKRIAISIANPKKYDELRKEKVGKTIWTFILISIIETIVLCGMLVFFGMGLLSIIDAKIAKVPNFTISNQGFTTEDNLPFMFKTDNNSYFVSIEPGSTMEDIKNNYSEQIFSASNYLLISNDQMVVRSSSKKDVFEFSSIPEDEVYTKDTFVNMYKDFLNGTMFKVICIVCALIICMYLIISKLSGGLIYALIGLIFSNIYKKKISFGQLYNIALYSTVTVTIIGILQVLTFITIPAWAIIKLVVICLYIAFGIKYCKNDNDKSDNVVIDNNIIEVEEKIENSNKEEEKIEKSEAESKEDDDKGE